VRFGDKDKKILKSENLPQEYETPIDISKIVLEPIKMWVERRVTEILGFEDDIVIGIINAQLEEPVEDKVDPKSIHLQLLGNYYLIMK